MSLNRALKLTLCTLFLFSLAYGYCQKEELTINKSDTVIDGKGGLFNNGKVTYLYINSKNTQEGWVQTKNITIKNCTIRGGIRIMGLGKNGQAPGVKESSLSLGHTERAQSVAPSNIFLQNIVFEASEGLTPLYIAPGATYITVENSFFLGESTGSGPIVYLDAESGHNVFRNNQFSIKSNREVIACDGSAYNLFEGNLFNTITKGGIFLYRNCGEGGAIRHQTPIQNIIRNNTFNLSDLVLGNYGIWLGSRNGNRNYCDADIGYPFGSSIDNSDFADNNILYNNVFIGGNEVWNIKDNGANNSISAGIDDLEMSNESILIVNNVVTFNNPYNSAFVRVYDSSGKVLVNTHTVGKQVDLFELPKGIYVLYIDVCNHMTKKKIVLLR